MTIVFSDLKGSTSLGEALDSEALREVMTRYFDAMRDELERHGGVIEKFIGDAVMAVFGLPRLHEDDALRAVRAAAGMQAALEALNDELQRVYGVQLANRTGVNTGEVVAGDPTTRPATRDRRRRQRRRPPRAGGRRARGPPRRAHLPPRPRRGRGRGGRAARAEGQVGARAGLPARRRERHAARRTTGRGGAARRPRDGARDARGDVARRRPRRALRTPRDDRRRRRGRQVAAHRRVPRVASRTRALVLSGRCLPYGDGITFWPLAEAVKRAAGIVDDDDADGGARQARARSPDPAGDGVTDAARRRRSA